MTGLAEGPSIVNQSDCLVVSFVWAVCVSHRVKVFEVPVGGGGILVVSSLPRGRRLFLELD